VWEMKMSAESFDIEWRESAGPEQQVIETQ
jgi:hypothetical protein